ncbi:MAG: divalent-cation tolerance protein CutA [Nibricoccus sp.]
MLLVGWTTVGNREDANRLARDLVEKGLAACVQIEGPITSHYVWQGKVEAAEEFRLMVKLIPARAHAVKSWIEQHHPYETPEWIVVRAEEVAEKYLSWARSNCTSAPL